VSRFKPPKLPARRMAELEQGPGTNGHRVSDGTGHIDSRKLVTPVDINEKETTTMSMATHRAKRQRKAAPSTAEQTLRSLDQAGPSLQTDKVPASLKKISNWVHWATQTG